MKLVALNGDVIFATGYGSKAGDQANAIAVDALGQSYLTGSISGNIVVGGKNLSINGLADIFVIKQSLDGQPLWAFNYGSAGADTAEGIASDAKGNTYITGSFRACY